MFKQTLSLVGYILLTLFLTGCVNMTDQAKTGFLTNYDDFVDISDPDYTKAYLSPNYIKSTLATMKKIKLIPFELWLKGDKGTVLSSEELQELSIHFNQKLRNEFIKNDYELVKRVGPNTFTIRGAFSSIKFENPELSPLDFIPFRIVINAGNYAYLQVADKKDVTTKVSIEIEFLKGMRRQRMLAAISTKYVDTTISNSGVDNVEAVKSLLDTWAENFVSRIVDIRAESEELAYET
jgi:hypothetical protein